MKSPNPKTEQQCFRLTPADNDRLHELAAAFGDSPTALFRHWIISTSPQALLKIYARRTETRVKELTKRMKEVGAK